MADYQHEYRGILRRARKEDGAFPSALVERRTDRMDLVAHGYHRPFDGTPRS